MLRMGSCWSGRLREPSCLVPGLGRVQTAAVPSGLDERRWQSSGRGRGDGAGTSSIEPREELRALQCFTEV